MSYLSGHLREVMALKKKCTYARNNMLSRSDSDSR